MRMLSKSVVKSKSPGNNYGFGGRLHAILVKRVFSKRPPSDQSLTWCHHYYYIRCHLL